MLWVCFFALVKRMASHFAQDIDELCDTVNEMDQGVITALR